MGSPGKFNKIGGGFNAYGNLQVLLQVIYQRGEPEYQFFNTDKREDTENQRTGLPAAPPFTGNNCCGDCQQAADNNSKQFMFAGAALL